MSFRTRIIVLLSAAIVLAVGFAGFAARQTTVKPIQKELVRSQIHEALQISRALRRGAQIEDFKEDTDARISIVTQRPVQQHQIGPRKKWRRKMIRDRPVFVRTGSHPAVVVPIQPERWLLLEPTTNAQQNQLFWILLFGGCVLLAAAILLATGLTRPLRDTHDALKKVSEGDLSQKLPVEGGPELEALASSFNEMTERISSMLRAEKQLMAGISHELRTPLARLRLQTELLKDEGVAEKRLEQMEANLEEIDHLVGEFLELSRLEAGAAIIAFQPVKLLDLARSCARVIHTHQIAFSSCDETVVQGDPARLQRVISTLLENALKYGSDAPIDISVYKGSLVVRDRGPGVPEKELQRIFEPFFRGTESQKIRGYGIGLSMAQQIVNLHGGHIEARNRPDGGLEIGFSLPLKQEASIDPDTPLPVPFEA